jgi:hypothetical protein
MVTRITQDVQRRPELDHRRNCRYRPSWSCVSHADYRDRHALAPPWPAVRSMVRDCKDASPVAVSTIGRIWAETEGKSIRKANLHLPRTLWRRPEERVGQSGPLASPTRSVGGELAARIARLWEPDADLREGADVHSVRTAYEALHTRYEPPAGIAIRPINTGGVPGLLLTPQQETPACLLYLHGGGYLAGSALGYRHLAGAVAAAAGAVAVLPAGARTPLPRPRSKTPCAATCGCLIRARAHRR